MTIKAVDLFCGVGGLTYGLQKAGIPVVAGIDIDDSCEYAYTSADRVQPPGGSSGDAAGYLEQGFHGAVGQQIYDQHQYGNELLAGRGLRTAGMPHGTL